MNNDLTIWILFGAVAMLMWRLDRLGKQLEAVCANIKIDLAPTEDRRDEFMAEWKQDLADAAKDRRQQLIGGGIICAIALGWYILSHK